MIVEFQKLLESILNDITKLDGTLWNLMCNYNLNTETWFVELGDEYNKALKNIDYNILEALNQDLKIFLGKK